MEIFECCASGLVQDYKTTAQLNIKQQMSKCVENIFERKINVEIFECCASELVRYCLTIAQLNIKRRLKHQLEEISLLNYLKGKGNKLQKKISLELEFWPHFLDILWFIPLTNVTN